MKVEFENLDNPGTFNSDIAGSATFVTKDGKKFLYFKDGYMGNLDNKYVEVEMDEEWK